MDMLPLCDKSIGGTCVVGLCTVCPHPRCSGVNKHVHFGVCLFLTGVCEVTEPSDTRTPIALYVNYYSGKSSLLW